MRQRFDQFFDALDFVQNRSKFALKDDRVQAWQVFLQRLLHVLPHEIGCVGETGTHHTFVAGANFVQVGGAAVAHGDEVGQHLAVFIQNCKVALLFAQHRN